MEFETVLEAIAHYSKNTPEQISLIDIASGNVITYKDLWNEICSFQSELIDSGLRQGDCVIAPLRQSIEFIVAAFAIQLAGGVLVPLEKQTSSSYLSKMANFTNARLYIGDCNGNPNIAEITLPTMSNTNKTEGANKIVIMPSSNALCNILFTTGTTGKSKGVMLSYKNMASSAYNLVSGMKLTHEDVALMPLPLHHIGGIRRLNSTLLVGAAAVISDAAFIKDSIVTGMEKYGVNVLHLVPYYLFFMLGNDVELLGKYSSQIRILSLGSSATTAAQCKIIKRILPRTKLFITYGVSEAGNISIHEFSAGEIREHCVGLPSKGVRVYFQNDDGEIFCATKENPGRLLVESDGVMLGYWGDESLSGSVLVTPRTLKTTDMGYADSDGNIYILGRVDDVFDIGGYKVSPLEIESLVMMRQDIKECLCVIDENRLAGKILKLLVVMKDGQEFSEKALYSYLAERMEIFKVPKSIAQVNEIPRENKLYKPVRRARK